jgi:cytosine deaminase
VSSLLLRGARLAGDDDRRVDVEVTDTVITAITPASSTPTATTPATTPPATTTIDLDGRLLLPAMAEPHAHLDKAFLAERIPNPTGDLMGAIVALDEHRDSIDLDDTVERAERAVRLMVSNGVTAIRTHADVSTTNGLTSVEAMLEVRSRVAHLVHLEICALTGSPSIGLVGADQRALLRDAIDTGVDLVGGCPHLEDDPVAATDLFLTTAAEHGLPVDLHTDETLDPNKLALEYLAHAVADGFPHRVTASHCVSLGMLHPDRQRAIAEAVAAAGIGVVALPHTNLFLQGRQHQQAMPRGLTAIGALRVAGVVVAAGADNLQDPFNPVGRGDPFETAALMVMAAHLLPGDAYASVSADVRTVLGLPPVTVAVGAPADLVAVAAGSVREAIAMGPGGRVVIARGTVVHDGRPAR